MTKHHPSCHPSDKDLVWHCSQCGINESAEQVESERDSYKAQAEALAKAVTDLLADSRSIEIRHYAKTQLAQWKEASK